MLRFSKSSFTTASSNPFFFSFIKNLLNFNKKILLHQFFFFIFFFFEKLGVVAYESKSQPHSVSETQIVYTKPDQVKERNKEKENLRS